MASRSLNQVQLIGNLTRDPELRYTPNGSAVCTIGLATNRSWTTQDGSGQRQEETTFHRIVLWSKLAEIAGQYLKKGAKVYFQGRLQNRKWTNKEGVEKETTEIVADQMIMLSSTGGGREEGAAGGKVQGNSSYEYPQEQGTPADTVTPAPSPEIGTSDVSDDIPF